MARTHKDDFFSDMICHTFSTGFNFLQTSLMSLIEFKLFIDSFNFFDFNFNVEICFRFVGLTFIGHLAKTVFFNYLKKLIFDFSWTSLAFLIFHFSCSWTYLDYEAAIRLSVLYPDKRTFIFNLDLEDTWRLQYFHFVFDFLKTFSKVILV